MERVGDLVYWASSGYALDLLGGAFVLDAEGRVGVSAPVRRRAWTLQARPPVSASAAQRRAWEAHRRDRLELADAMLAQWQAYKAAVEREGETYGSS